MNDRTFHCETEQQRAHLSVFVLRQPLPFQAILGPLREKRSLPQNARLWKLHTLAGEFTGYTPEEMHEEALCKHFGYTEQERKDLFTGEITMKRVPLKRSSTRDKAEFAKFMEATEKLVRLRVRRVAASRGNGVNKEQYIEAIHGLPCVVCFLLTGQRRYGVEGHHPESVRDELSDWLEVPVCQEHHTGPNGIHGLSRRGFETRYKLDDLALVAGTIKLLAQT